MDNYRRKTARCCYILYKKPDWEDDAYIEGI